jgi:hypothetical protein
VTGPGSLNDGRTPAMDERPWGRIEWVRTRRGRVAHALLAETHPELDLRAIAWRHSWLANVQPGLPLCDYAQGSGDWQPAGRQRPCKVCAWYLEDLDGEARTMRVGVSKTWIDDHHALWTFEGWIELGDPALLGDSNAEVLLRFTPTEAARLASALWAAATPAQREKGQGAGP